MYASRSKFEVFNPEIAEETEVLRRNNECDWAIFKTGNGESGNRGIRESRTDKTGILVCLLENAFATVYNANQLS
jgi:hypothetical protein